MEMKIDLQLPKLTIQDQLKEYSGTGKIFIGFINNEGHLHYHWENLNLSEKLVVIDSFKRLLDHELREDG